VNADRRPARARSQDATALVTGSASGIGLELVRALVERGAAKVYAGVRDIATLESQFDGLPVEVVELDITNPGQVAAAVDRCGDVSLLINNAGYASTQRLIFTDDEAAARREMEVNYFGTLAVIRGFAPVLRRNGGGCIANVLSVAATIPFPVAGGYSAAKAAALFLSTIARAELIEQRTEVISLIVGSVDTKMSAHVTGEKQKPRDVARSMLYAIDHGIEVFDTDPMAVAARASYALDPVRYQRALARQLARNEIRVSSGSGGPADGAADPA
jgi:NAD(P)-dependent dehydrogenase (short-subunit alcohol dehydrogenase family)